MFWNNGSMKLSAEPNELVREDIYKLFPYEAGCSVSGDSIYFDECPYFIETKLEILKTILSNAGISIYYGNIRYYGDQDGGYVWYNGNLIPLNLDAYIIRTADSSTLVEELMRRGYSVKSNLEVAS